MCRHNTVQLSVVSPSPKVGGGAEPTRPAKSATALYMTYVSMTYGLLHMHMHDLTIHFYSLQNDNDAHKKDHNNSIKA